MTVSCHDILENEYSVEKLEREIIQSEGDLRAGNGSKEDKWKNQKIEDLGHWEPELEDFADFLRSNRISVYE